MPEEQAGGGASDSAKLSDYERKREQNIQTNKQLLDSLGLTGYCLTRERQTTTTGVEERRDRVLNALLRKLKEEQQNIDQVQKQLEARACEVHKRVGDKVPEACRISCTEPTELSWKRNFDTGIPSGFDARMLCGVLIQR